MDPYNVSDDEIVTLPVPKRYLAVMIQALAKAMEAPVAPPVVTGPEQTQTDKQAASATSDIDWAKVENMRKLRKGLTVPIGIVLLDATAARAGEMVEPFEEIFKQAAVKQPNLKTSQQARSSLGALTKVIKREFGVPYEKATWPVEHRWAYHGDSQYYYCMTVQVAQAWIQSAK